jgi:hypothetical protein
MKKRKRLDLTIMLNTLLAVIISASVQSKTANKLPTILDYYPSCDYQTVRSYTVKEKTINPLKKEITDKLLKKLQNKALNIGADAVIIEQRNIKKYQDNEGSYGSNSNQNNKSIVSYEGLLIKTCQSSSTAKRKAAPFNHLGQPVIKMKATTISLSTKIVFTPPVKTTLHRPTISNNEISLTHGIYGLKMGASYSEVHATLGDHSFAFDLFEDQQIIGYGRSHWLFFQANKLVKVSTQYSVLSMDTLNKIPLIDFFDDAKWKINALVGRKSSLAEVKKSLNIQGELNAKKQLIIKDNNNTMLLSFDSNKSPVDNKYIYSLSDFTVKSNSYKEPSHKADLPKPKHFSALKLILTTLDQGEDGVVWSELSEDLGKPIGRITISAQSYINIYNENLAVLIKHRALNTIYLLEEVFQHKKNNDHWSLGPFSQGKTVAQLSAYLSEDDYLDESEVMINADNYQLSLFFDYDNLGLYEATLKVN